jgi:CRP-like cAMP-binding protein
MSAPAPARNRRPFDLAKFLSTKGRGRKLVSFHKKQTIFAQGDRSDAVFYIRRGRIRLTVVAENGKEATIAILGEGDYFGEGCLTKQPRRICFASAMSDSSMMRITKQTMLDALRREHNFSNTFLSYLLRRNIRYEEDLVDQLFNSSEKRLARILLLLSHFDDKRGSDIAPKISQETLAQMIGTTRSRVNFFMNRFRKLGLIDYNGTLRVYRSLVRVILHE